MLRRVVCAAEVVFEECGKPGGVQMMLVPYAVCGLCVYTLGYPALVCWILYKHRDRIMEDQLLRADDRGTSRLENPNCYDMRKMFHKCVAANAFELKHLCDAAIGLLL